MHLSLSSILLVSCHTMWFIILTHCHNLPSLSILAGGRWKGRWERVFTLCWIHCSQSNSDLSTACACRIKPTWACSPGSRRTCRHIFTGWKEGLIYHEADTSNIPSHNMLCRLFLLSRHICWLMLRAQTRQRWLICVTSSQGSMFERNAGHPHRGKFRDGRSHCTLVKHHSWMLETRDKQPVRVESRSEAENN